MPMSQHFQLSVFDNQEKTTSQFKSRSVGPEQSSSSARYRFVQSMLDVRPQVVNSHSFTMRSSVRKLYNANCLLTNSGLISDSL